MKRIDELKEECAFWIDGMNLEVTKAEIDFLCEAIVKDILGELASYVDRRLPASSYVNALKIYMGMK